MISVAIDGPSGAGKSTISKFIAKKFEFVHVDTGAIYRTLGIHVKTNGISPADREGVCALLPDVNIAIKYIDGVQHMFLNREDVTHLLREHIISKYASDVSAIPEVREFLLDMQRSLAESYNVVMDGRDIATVVLPESDIKIFLTATPEARAERRYKELLEKGQSVEFSDVLKDIKKRDFNDSNRDAAPLRPHENSVIVDTTELSIEESMDKISQIVEIKLNQGR